MQKTFNHKLGNGVSQSHNHEKQVMKSVIKSASIGLITLACLAVNAQTVDVVRRAYQETPSLPIAPSMNPSSTNRGGTSNQSFVAATTDINIRTVIENWSKAAGWSFGLVHWNSDRDLPVLGNARFQGDYKSAVRQLLASTELTDTPLQPCFYSNFVLRVVPRSEKCDRMSASAGEAK